MQIDDDQDNSVDYEGDGPIISDGEGEAVACTQITCNDGDMADRFAMLGKRHCLHQETEDHRG